MNIFLKTESGCSGQFQRQTREMKNIMQDQQPESTPTANSRDDQPCANLLVIF
jgi:hypothetical protein